MCCLSVLCIGCNNNRDMVPWQRRNRLPHWFWGHHILQWLNLPWWLRAYILQLSVTCGHMFRDCMHRTHWKFLLPRVQWAFICVEEVFRYCLWFLCTECIKLLNSGSCVSQSVWFISQTSECILMKFSTWSVHWTSANCIMVLISAIEPPLYVTLKSIFFSPKRVTTQETGAWHEAWTL